jgi:hypothetical protein
MNEYDAVSAVMCQLQWPVDGLHQLHLHGLHQQHVHTSPLLVWDALMDFAVI